MATTAATTLFQEKKACGSNFREETQYTQLSEKWRNAGETCKKKNMYGLGHSTIGDIKKIQNKLKSFASTMESFAMSSKGRKIMRMADNEKLDLAATKCFANLKQLKLDPFLNQ